MLFRVQASALLAAIALTVTVLPAQARAYPCWLVRWYVEGKSAAELEALARKHKITAKERTAHAVCLKEKK